jgi:hypothetical protein
MWYLWLFGILCLIYLISILNFHGVSKHPYCYPISMLLGLVSLIVCFIMCITIITNSMKEYSIIKCIGFQSLVTIFSFIISFIIFVILGNIIGI